MKNIIYTLLLSLLLYSTTSFASDLRFQGTKDSVQNQLKSQEISATKEADSKISKFTKRITEKKDKITAKCQQEEQSLKDQMTGKNGYYY